MNRFRTYIAYFMMVAVLTTAFSVPQRSHAIPAAIVADPWTLIQTIAVKVGNELTNVGSAASVGLAKKELVLDGIASAAFGVLRKALVNSVLDWAKGGFDGKPAFVQNLNDTLDALADKTASDFIQGSALSALCSPFALQVKGALALNYKDQRGAGTQIRRCTFDTISKNINNFGKSVDKAKEMTFADLFNYTSNPVNSPQGAYLDARAKMEIAIINKKGEKIKLLEFGDGFLSKEECFPTDETGANFKCQVVTPGDTISASINKSLGLGADALVNADEINEFVSAAIGTVMQNVLSKGLSGYNPSTAPSGEYGYAASDIEYTSNSGAIIEGILPTQQTAIDQLVNAQTDIETTCYVRPNPADEFGESTTWTDEQYAADRLKQLQDKGVYELLLQTIIKVGDAQRGYDELGKLLVRARNAVTSAESIAVTQEVSNLTNKSYIYTDNERSGAILADVQSQVSSKCGRFDFGGGGS